MLEHSQRREVGAVGARLLFPNGTSSTRRGGGIGGKAGHPSGAFRRPPGYYDFARVIRNLSAVTAACLMTRKSVFEDVNGSDDSLFAISYNDVADLCLRLGVAAISSSTPVRGALPPSIRLAWRVPGIPNKSKSEDLLQARWKSVLRRATRITILTSPSRTSTSRFASESLPRRHPRRGDRARTVATKHEKDDRRGRAGLRAVGRVF